jgi:hypothetical protein
MLTQKEENENVSSSYFCPYLAKVHQQILLYRSRDKETLVYTISKFSFPTGRIVFVTNAVDFWFTLFCGFNGKK